MNRITLEIQHDDNPDVIIENVNKALRKAKAGWQFEYDESKNEEGQVTYSLQEVH